MTRSGEVGRGGARRIPRSGETRPPIERLSAVPDVTMMLVRIENGKPTARWGRKARGLSTRRLGYRNRDPLMDGGRNLARAGGRRRRVHWSDGDTALALALSGPRHPGGADRSESIRVADGERCGGQCRHGGSEVHRPRPDPRAGS